MNVNEVGDTGQCFQFKNTLTYSNREASKTNNRFGSFCRTVGILYSTKRSSRICEMVILWRVRTVNFKSTPLCLASTLQTRFFDTFEKNGNDSQFWIYFWPPKIFSSLHLEPWRRPRAHTQPTQLYTPHSTQPFTIHSIGSIDLIQLSL